MLTSAPASGERDASPLPIVMAQSCSQDSSFACSCSRGPEPGLSSFRARCASAHREGNAAHTRHKQQAHTPSSRKAVRRRHARTPTPTQLIEMALLLRANASAACTSIARGSVTRTATRVRCVQLGPARGRACGLGVRESRLASEQGIPRRRKRTRGQARLHRAQRACRDSRELRVLSHVRHSPPSPASPADSGHELRWGSQHQLIRSICALCVALQVTIIRAPMPPGRKAAMIARSASSSVASPSALSSPTGHRSDDIWCVSCLRSVQRGFNTVPRHPGGCAPFLPGGRAWHGQPNRNATRPQAENRDRSPSPAQASGEAGRGAGGPGDVHTARQGPRTACAARLVGAHVLQPQDAAPALHGAGPGPAVGGAARQQGRRRPRRAPAGHGQVRERTLCQSPSRLSRR